jgi:hypothetical protein
MAIGKRQTDELCDQKVRNQAAVLFQGIIESVTNYLTHLYEAFEDGSFCVQDG